MTQLKNNTLNEVKCRYEDNSPLACTVVTTFTISSFHSAENSASSSASWSPLEVLSLPVISFLRQFALVVNITTCISFKLCRRLLRRISVFRILFSPYFVWCKQRHWNGSKCFCVRFLWQALDGANIVSSVAIFFDLRNITRWRYIALY